jgi:hypothetical protein
MVSSHQIAPPSLSVSSQASAVAGGVVGGAGTEEKTADLGKKKRSATFFLHNGLGLFFYSMDWAC